MATTFSSLYGFIRAILGDRDPVRVMYSDDVLDQHISLAAMMLMDSAVVVDEESDPLAFTTTLSTTNKGIVVLEAALTILGPNSEYFSYRTPIHSVTRSGGVNSIISWIEDRLGDLRGGRFAFTADNELIALVNGAERFIDAFDEALAGP